MFDLLYFIYAYNASQIHVRMRGCGGFKCLVLNQTDDALDRWKLRGVQQQVKASFKQFFVQYITLLQEDDVKISLNLSI